MGVIRKSTTNTILSGFSFNGAGSSKLFIPTSSTDVKVSLIDNYAQIVNSTGVTPLNINTTSGNLSTARAELGGVGTANAALAIGGAGGTFGTPTVLSTVEVFQGTFWASHSSISAGKRLLSSAGIQHAALAVGGAITGGTLSSSAEKSIVTTWSSTGSFSTAKCRFATSGTQNAALAFGGSTTLNTPYSVVSTAEKFNGSTWSTTGSLLNARAALAGCGTQNAALAVGGFTTVPIVISEKFNGSVWSSTSSLPTSRANVNGTVSGTQNYAISIASNGTAVFVNNNWSYTMVSTSALNPLNHASSGNFSSCSSFGGWTNSTGSAPPASATVKSFISSLFRSIITNKFDDNNISVESDTVISTSNPFLVETHELPYASLGELNDGLVELEKHLPDYSWFSTGFSIINQRYYLASSGTANAALAIGGVDTVSTVVAFVEKITNSISFNTHPMSFINYSLAASGIVPATLVFGGYAYNNSIAETLLGTVSPSTNVLKFNGVWSSSTSLSTARAELAGCGTQNATLAVGGNTNTTNSPTRTNLVEKFNGTTWSASININTSRFSMGIAGSQNTAVIFGGDTSTTVTPVVSGITEKFNGSAWSVSGSLIQSRARFGGSGIQNSARAVAGSGPSMASSELYDGSNWYMGPYANVTRTRFDAVGTSSSTTIFGSSESGTIERLISRNAVSATAQIPVLSTTNILGGLVFPVE